jgi:hypothetical protein
MNQQMTMTASQPASYPARPMTVIVRSSAETADRAIILSVINMLFCCFLFGIIALIFAIRGKDLIQTGIEEEGLRMIRTANIINIVGVAVIALLIVVAVIVLVA